jgi:hypothetical protein
MALFEFEAKAKILGRITLDGQDCFWLTKQAAAI